MTRVPDPSVLTEASNSASTSIPARRTNSGSHPAATRSSPSAMKRPSRLPRAILRISLSLRLSVDVITKKGASPGALEVVGSAPRSGSRRLPGALGKTSKGLRVADGDVGEDLAVELDLGEPEPVHELAVAESLPPRRGADAGDPQAPEVALAVAAATVGVRIGLEELLLGTLGVRL